MAVDDDNAVAVMAAVIAPYWSRLKDLDPGLAPSMIQSRGPRTPAEAIAEFAVRLKDAVEDALEP